MIKTRRPETDINRSCAKCKHLRLKDAYRCIYICGIDGAECPDLNLISVTTCDKWKEVGNGKL